MAKILIVEDEISVALELEELLVSDGFEISEVTTTGSESISSAERLRPDVVLMDIKLKGEMDGIEAAEQILRKFGVNSLFLTGHSDDKLIKRASEVEPLGYILKPIDAPQILAAVKIACHIASVTREKEKQRRKTLLNGRNDISRAYLSEKLSVLTPSELRVAALIIQDIQTKQIAVKLNVSLHTVEWHRGHIREKLGLLDRKESLMLHLLSLI